MNFRIENLIDLKSHHGSNTAVIVKDSTKSYSELDKLSASFAAYISDKISKKELVGIYLDNSIEFIISVISLWKLGAVPVPLNLLAAEDELLKLVSITTLKTIITDEIHSQKIKHPGSVNLIPLDFRKFNFKKPSQRFIISDFNENDEAVVIFTSGSTGGPKGVVHTFHSLLSSIINGNDILNHSAGDRWLASLPFYHIGGFQIICRALYYSVSIIIPESLQTNHLSKAIPEFKPTHASYVSPQLKRLLDNKIKPNDELRCSLIGGGFIDKNLLLDAKKLGWHPIKVYGSSETASFVCALSENDIEEKGDSNGKPIGTNQIKIVDEKGIECPFQTEGEIVIKSDSLFKNYLNNESETENKLKQDSYCTGDLGYLDDDGFLYVTGRKNEMIVTGGKNVNPLEVETAILKYQGIVDAAVFPVDDVEWGEIVCAAVVSSKKIDLKELRIFIKNTLSSYKVPKKIFFEDVLPKTSLGKIERSKLKKKYSGI
jgi:o-succinylbenzoate---CoA ligase